MATTTPRYQPTAFIIKTDRNGKRRAQYLSRMQFRMFPFPIADADLLIATGQAVILDRHPLTGEPVGAALSVVR